MIGEQAGDNKALEEGVTAFREALKEWTRTRAPLEQAEPGTIEAMVVNSLITSPNDGTRVKAGSKTAISGIAWDGGYGIRSVEMSADDGKTWAEVSLGEDLGKFAFRPWSHDFTPKTRGNLSLTTRATNKVGQTQTKELIQNPAGYHHNLIQTLTLDVA